MSKLTEDFWKGVEKYGFTKQLVRDWRQSGYAKIPPDLASANYNFNGSRFTCGIGEIGSLYGLGSNGSNTYIEDTLHKAIANAIWQNRGLIYFFKPNSSWIYDDLFKKLGFETNRVFYNPNSRHEVQEWSVILPGPDDLK